MHTSLKCPTLIPLEARLATPVKPTSFTPTWGSECWVKDLDEKEGKLGKQVWKGKMVGYMGRHGYHLYDPKRFRVFKVRNVIFEEGAPHRMCMAVEPDEDQLPQDPMIFGEDVPHKAAGPVPPSPLPSLPNPPAVPEIRRTVWVPNARLETAIQGSSFYSKLNQPGDGYPSSYG
ncbi:hypothetical protein B0H17DRAFT_1142674 [Mycena rosella]|uniref:Retroviral polymerase SH3-like domain-containing protein n=1 Tax=Mycena rosella TaxID=1033263 RepID=A0AAD7CXD4_MYCRO|nr:hypothetical protein B0H17DRAFT_1142674 [Mycena rosella]